MRNLIAEQNRAIEDHARAMIDAVNASQREFNVKHDRTKPATKIRGTVKHKGEVSIIKTGITKGKVMSHKGKGKYPDNRKEKPFYNPHAEKCVEELGDELLRITGDIIVGNLSIR